MTMVGEATPAFDEIFYCQPVGPGRDTFSRQFVCAPHQEFVCGTCKMDLSLLNELRYDKEYLVLAGSATKRMERIRSVVHYYYKNPRAEFRRDPSKRRSPHLEFLLNQFSGNKGVSVAKVIELAGYLSYVCRSDTAARQRIATTLDTVLQADLEAASRTHRVQETSLYDSNDLSSDEGIPVPIPRAKTENVSDHFSQSEQADNPAVSSRQMTHNAAKRILSFQIQNLTDQYKSTFRQCRKMLKQEGVTSYGQFFDNFKRVVSEGDEEAWTRFLRKHAKTGVPPTNLDPEDWSQTRLKKFLDYQNISLSPSPSKETMAATARKMLEFSSSCKHILYHYSIIKGDDRKENPLGSRDSNRCLSVPEEVKVPVTLADSESLEKSKPQWTPPKPKFLVEPQTALNVRLSQIPSWKKLGKFVKCHPFFVRNRISYTKAFPLDSEFRRVLDILELIADTHDRAQESHPVQDFLIVLTSQDNSNPEVSLAIRCLEASNLGTFSRPVPLLQLEYLAAEHDPSSVEYKRLSKGVRSGVTRFINETCEKTDMDLLLLLFQENRKQLEEDGVSRAQISDGWNFTVARVADPAHRGAHPLCPGCDKPASMMCSVCRNISYCSRECQVQDWQSHYKVCRPCKEHGKEI